MPVKKPVLWFRLCDAGLKFLPWITTLMPYLRKFPTHALWGCRSSAAAAQKSLSHRSTWVASRTRLPVKHLRYPWYSQFCYARYCPRIENRLHAIQIVSILLSTKRLRVHGDLKLTSSWPVKNSLRKEALCLKLAFSSLASSSSVTSFNATLE